MKGAALALALAASLLGGAPAAAQPSDAESRARAHYEVGLGMYHLGNYSDAVREFSAGYELSPRAEFLINLGQAYRKLHDLDRARQMFQRYLQQTGPEAADRAQVQALLAEVNRAAASESAGAPSSDQAAASAAAARTAPDLTPGVAPTPGLAPAPASASSVAASAPPHRSALRRFWWTIPVGALLVGTAVGLAVYFSLPPSQTSCGSATIGCIDARP